MSHSIAAIKAIFQPRSVAVVGASTDPAKLGTVLLRNLVKGGFAGKIYPINPKYDKIAGLKSYPSVSAIPGEVDQVSILIPASGVLSVVEDCVAKKVKSIIIISAGFGEFNKEGKALEDKVATLCRANNIALVGPNIIGVINPYHKLNNSWMQFMPSKGDIAFVSQSGALCTSVLDMASRLDLAFFNFCSFGNKADVDELDLFKMWQAEKKVEVIGAYLEEISCGEDFIHYIENNVDKPVVILKPGKSDVAKAAIASHTGSMAGSVETVATAFKKAGIIEATTTTEFFNALQAFSFTDKLPKGKRVCVITNAGGGGIITTDEIAAKGLQLAPLSSKIQAELTQNLPMAASSKNPVDVLGEAPAARYETAAKIIAKDSSRVDIVVFVLTPQYVTDIDGTAKIIAQFAKDNPDLLVTAVFIGDDKVRSGIDYLTKKKILAYADPAAAIQTISHLVNYADYVESRQPKQLAEKYAQLKQVGAGRYHAEVAGASAAATKNNNVLSEDLVNKILAEIKLDMPKQAVVASLAEAKKFCAPIYPVVIKAPNEAITHKTDFKAVYVGINNEAELSQAYSELEKTIRKHGTPAFQKNPQVLIQEMIKSQLEMIVGANRDGASDVYTAGRAGFGHLMVFGQGGIYTEVYKDLAYALVPASQQEISLALHGTKASQILSGVRGEAPLAEKAVIDAITKVQKMLLLYPEIVSVDINPLLVTHQRAVAVDVKVFLAK